MIITPNTQLQDQQTHERYNEVFQKLHIPTENMNFGTLKCLLLHKFYSVERLWLTNGSQYFTVTITVKPELIQCLISFSSPQWTHRPYAHQAETW